jgi:hypothetical protein
MMMPKRSRSALRGAEHREILFFMYMYAYKRST